MQSFILIALVSLEWIYLGYTMSFGPDVGGIIGDLSMIGLKGVGAAPNPGLRADHSSICFHDLSVHVRGDYTGTDYRGLCRAHEIRPVSSF